MVFLLEQLDENEIIVGSNKIMIKNKKYKLEYKISINKNK